MNQAEQQQQLEERIQKEKNSTIRFVLLQQLADKSVVQGQQLAGTSEAEEKFKYAKQKYVQALQLARKMRNNKLQLDTLTDLGSTAENLQDDKLAIEYYEKALKISHEMQNYIAQNYIYDKLGSFYWRIGDIDLSIEYYNLAADAAEMAQSSTIDEEEKQIASTSTPEIAEKSSQRSTPVEKSIEVSNEIKQIKRSHIAQKLLTIIVDIALVIILFIVRVIISNKEYVSTLLLVFSVFITVVGAILTYRTFVPSLNLYKLWGRLVGRFRRQ